MHFKLVSMVTEPLRDRDLDLRDRYLSQSPLPAAYR